MYMYIRIKYIQNKEIYSKYDKGGKKGPDVKGARRGETQPLSGLQ